MTAPDRWFSIERAPEGYLLDGRPLGDGDLIEVFAHHETHGGDAALRWFRRPYVLARFVWSGRDDDEPRLLTDSGEVILAGKALLGAARFRRTGA